jgi:hypothetical protein
MTPRMNRSRQYIETYIVVNRVMGEMMLDIVQSLANIVDIVKRRQQLGEDMLAELEEKCDANQRG